MTTEQTVTIDEDMALVIYAIDTLDNPTTTTVRNYIDWDAPNKVKYRVRKLENAGLAKVERQEVGDDGRQKPLRYTLTDSTLITDAEEVLQSGDEHDSGQAEQIVSNDRRIQALFRRRVDSEQRIMDLEDRVEELEAQLGDGR